MKREQSRLSVDGSSPGADVFADFLEPFLHHALRLRNVYDAVQFQEVVAFDVVVWRCNHPKVTEYIRKAVVGCKAAIEQNKLSRVHLSFFDEMNRKTDQVCICFSGSFPAVVDQKNALWLYNWFREALLNLESQLKGLDATATRFQVEVSMDGIMTENRHEWSIVEGSTCSQIPAIVDPVRAVGEKVPMEVFVKRFGSEDAI
jgi:hypothetical protein